MGARPGEPMSKNEIADPAAFVPKTPREELTLVQKLRPIALRWYLPSRSRYSFGVMRAMAMRPWALELWYRSRAARFLLFGKGLRQLEISKDVPQGFVKHVSAYNQTQLWEFYRERTEKLMGVMRMLDNIPKDGNVLVIGPRNEAELLLLSHYGFKLKNITSVDLFTYSPKIELADMHALPHADNSFDVTYSAWTLKYSYNIQKACDELVRVTRPGGHIVIGFTHTQTVTPVIGAPLRGGIEEIKSYFAKNLDVVSFQEESLESEGTWKTSLIFRIRK